MYKYVERPNLPVNNVSRIIAGRIPESAENDIRNYGVEIIVINSDPELKNLSNHADLQVIHLSYNKILINNTQTELISRLINYGFDVESFSIKSGEYPFDCAVNVAFMGNKVICKYDILENKLKEYIDENGYEIVNVNQGYSKCSVCVVNDNSIITEDENIKNACEMHGIDVLLLRKGYVRLEGFEYGFIGGASFKLNDKTLAFIGRVENHPDFLKINSFLRKRGIDHLSLGNTELTDIGSVIPINE